jgi:hypothetical protein
VSAGVPLFNFISMSDREFNLNAAEVRLTLENRKAPGKFFVIDTGDPKEPVITPSLRMRSRSAFGVRLQGEFDNAREVSGATVRVGDEDFNLVPLTSFDFENLALKVNRLNLGSPDFSDDWRVLKLEAMGSREPLKRRRRLIVTPGLLLSQQFVSPVTCSPSHKSMPGRRRRRWQPVAWSSHPAQRDAYSPMVIPFSGQHRDRRNA